ncbi:MAG: class I SAM-dependent methyltransferase [Actinomycetota bacterium]|nr:class I SAM-dependent methyltransferase [Actinomycetota bacterium]
MIDHDEYYADRFAESYDAWCDMLPDTDATVACLSELAGFGPVLELGIGTGRVALPLKERGLEVHGVDRSEAMVSQLRAKPGGDGIPVTIGDFSEVPVEGTFSLVFLASGTFFELPSPEAQLRCFQNVAKALAPDGLFVFDSMMPDSSRRFNNQDVGIVPTRGNQLVLQFRQYYPHEQRSTCDYVIICDNDVRHMRVRFRYAWPAELDLMARLAGLRLRDRWGSWRRGAFTAASTHHVAVYELPR